MFYPRIWYVVMFDNGQKLEGCVVLEKGEDREKLINDMKEAVIHYYKKRSQMSGFYVKFDARIIDLSKTCYVEIF